MSKRRQLCNCGESDPNGPRHYKVVRFYFRPGVPRPRRTIKSGLTLAEAQAHCQDPETSSSTATSARARRYTATHGEWLDGYTHE